ncbi:MAG: class I SAM-dependent methyltransferase [Eubacteriales bacterium]
MNDRERIRQFYNNATDAEWMRIADRPEFLITCRFLDRYLRPGDTVLDIGGGPGRYSVYLAKRGCRVTLMDLSDENVRAARRHAEEAGVEIDAMQGDACHADELLAGRQFDHVLLMGPLYHLLEETERTAAVNAALHLLKPGGELFASFIGMMGGIIYYMKEAPEMMLSPNPSEVEFNRRFREGESYSGDAFTRAHFTQIDDALAFMNRFDDQLEKLHFFGQEGILSPCEANIMAGSREVVDAWVDLAVQLCDRPEYLTWSEHLMYVGRKRERKEKSHAES